MYTHKTRSIIENIKEGENKKNLSILVNNSIKCTRLWKPHYWQTTSGINAVIIWKHTLKTWGVAVDNRLQQQSLLPLWPVLIDPHLLTSQASGWLSTPWLSVKVQLAHWQSLHLKWTNWSCIKAPILFIMSSFQMCILKEQTHRLTCLPHNKKKHVFVFIYKT